MKATWWALTAVRIDDTGLHQLLLHSKVVRIWLTAPKAPLAILLLASCLVILSFHVTSLALGVVLIAR